MTIATKPPEEATLAVMRPGEFLLLFTTVLSICFLNVSSISTSNFNIAILQLFFVGSSLFLLRHDIPELATPAAVILGILFSLTISNGLAQSDGLETADWRRVIEVSTHLAFAMICSAWFMARKFAIHCFAKSILLAVSFYFVILVVFWTSSGDPFSYPWIHAPPLFNHIRHTGYFLCAGVVVAGWSTFQFRGLQRSLSWAVFVIALAMLLWTGSRGATLAATVGMLSLAIHFTPRAHSGSWKALLLGALIALFLSAVFETGQRSMGWLAAFERSASASSLDQLSSSRLTIWSHLVPYIAERPLFGWGGEGFRAVWTTRGVVQAHNVLFQLLIEWGLVGAILIGGFLGWLTVKGGKLYIAQRCSKCIPPALTLGFPLIAALWALSAVDGVFYHGTPMALMMAGFGMILSVIIKRNR